MAILSGIMSDLDKSAGEWTFYRRKGKNIAKQKMKKPATPTRTFKLQKRRSTISNVERFWGCTRSLLKYTMELRKETETEYNVFVSINLNNSKVFLTKEQSEKRTCILDNYVVSYGTLPGTIGVREQGDKMVSTLCLGDLVIGPDTTVLDLCVALQSNNPYIQQGDRIFFYRGTQQPAQDGVEPTVEFYCKGITLEGDEEAKKVKLSSQGIADGFESVAVDGVYYLGCQKKANSMVAWCRSRYVWNKAQQKSLVMCTTQHLVGSNSLLADYSSKMALYKAIKSHGGVNREDIASPDYVDYKAFELEMEKEIQQGLSGDNNQVQKVQLTFTVNNSALGEVTPASGEYTVGTTITATARVKSGAQAEFTGWSDGVGTATRTIQVPAEPKTYTANFRTTGSLGV